MNFAELIPPGSDAENAIVALAALAAGVNVLVFYRALIVRDPMSARIRALKDRRDALRQGVTAPRRRARREMGRETSIGAMRRVLGRLKLLGTQQSEKAALSLARAGWRSRDSLIFYFFLKLALPFVFGAAVLFATFVLGAFHLNPTQVAIAVLLGIVAGAYGPNLYVRNAATKRRKALQRGLPDTLDLLVICAEAGQTLDAALGRVAREMETACPPVADEFSLTALELGLLPDRRQALDHLNARTNMASIRGVVNTLLQTERYGTPLAQSLRILAAEFRHERLMRAETKAAKLPATLTVPMILFIMPSLFVVLIGPAILRVLDLFIRHHPGG
jgi:tight adherence protein C